MSQKMIVFIEFWKAKKALINLSQQERSSYVEQMAPVIQELASKNVIIDSWGLNSDKTAYKADFDFYAITKFPSQELLEEFLIIVESAGWYNYFDQINMTGENIGPEEVINQMVKM